jgi:phosphoribosylformylglycinamidine synthase PurS subunit
MRFPLPKVSVTVTLKPTLLDAQGRTVAGALRSMGYTSVSDVRVGKVIVLEVEGDTPEAIRSQVAEMCDRLLANPVMEDYRIEIGS